jgi:hypothetical protein
MKVLREMGTALGIRAGRAVRIQEDTAAEGAVSIV